jgi:hypothetical protein
MKKRWTHPMIISLLMATSDPAQAEWPILSWMERATRSGSSSMAEPQDKTEFLAVFHEE